MTTLYESILKDLSEQHINKNVYPTPQQAELKLKEMCIRDRTMTVN